MDNKEKVKEKHISLLELEGEELDKELTVEQKKAAIRELKDRYGRDWKKIIGGAVKSLKINRETLQTLHGLGVDSSLRDLSDPRSFSRHKNIEGAFKE